MVIINRNNNKNRPKLKVKKFTTLHIELFEQLLYSGKTNWDINLAYGYTKRSHCIVDHTRKVMYKILAAENLSKDEYKEQVIYPRVYHLWWKRLFEKHKDTLQRKAVRPLYYDGRTGGSQAAREP
jgi:hypothetical protein